MYVCLRLVMTKALHFPWPRDPVYLDELLLTSVKFFTYLLQITSELLSHLLQQYLLKPLCWKWILADNDVLNNHCYAEWGGNTRSNQKRNTTPFMGDRRTIPFEHNCPPTRKNSPCTLPQNYFQCLLSFSISITQSFTVLKATTGFENPCSDHCLLSLAPTPLSHPWHTPLDCKILHFQNWKLHFSNIIEISFMASQIRNRCSVQTALLWSLYFASLWRQSQHWFSRPCQ